MCYGIIREELDGNHTNIEENGSEQRGKPCPNDVIEALASSCA